LSEAEKALANTKMALNQVSQTEGLGNEKTAYETEGTRRNLINAFIVKKNGAGMSHMAARELAKTMHPQVFAKIGQEELEDMVYTRSVIFWAFFTPKPNRSGTGNLR
jgi:hypothetical protein